MKTIYLQRLLTLAALLVLPGLDLKGGNCSPAKPASGNSHLHAVRSHPKPDDSNTAVEAELTTVTSSTSASRLEDLPATSSIEPFFLSLFNDTESWETSRSALDTTTASTSSSSLLPASQDVPTSSSSSPFGTNFADVIGLKNTRILQLANANNEFAFKLAKVLMASNPQRNVFFSPLTLYSTLITILTGASGQTSSELSQALGLVNFTETDIQEGFRDVLHSIQKDAGEANKLNMLNALFVDKTSNISTKYTDRVRTYFNAYLEKVGFASEPDYVLEWVNKLVSWWTEGHIKTLLDSPPDALTKLLIVNAIFFRGKWAETFDSRFTSIETFTNADGSRHSVEMMKRSERIQVYCGNSTYIADQICAFELLYSGGNLSFLVILPASGTDLSKLQDALSPQMMYDMISRLEERTYELGLPKLTLSTSYDLRDSLRALGMKSAFEPAAADLTRMSANSTGLFVSELTHKNVLEISEEGTIAASAAFASIGNRRKPPRLYVDRPFLLLVRDLKTDAILFLGRVNSLP